MCLFSIFCPALGQYFTAGSVNANASEQVIKSRRLQREPPRCKRWRQFSMIVNHRLLSCQQAVDTVFGLNMNVGAGRR